MSRTQVAAVAVTIAISALDGYDVLSMTFAAPAISLAWGLDKATLGLLLASGLLGMAAGALGLSPLADIIGRRWAILIGLAFMGVGMFVSAFTSTVIELAACRVFTGVGIGLCVAVITPLAAEFANRKNRALAVSAMAVGYPVGGMIGGVLASFLLSAFGWPSVFIAGSLFAVVLLPAVLVWLPEPPAFLLARRGSHSLARINAFLARCGHPMVAQLPVAESKPTSSYGALFSRTMISRTLRITVVNMLFVMTVYYVLSWLPQMVADGGFSAATGSFVSSVASLAGVVACIVLGIMARRGGLHRLVVGAMIGLGVATVAFGFTPSSLPMLCAAAAIAGVFLYSGIAGLYTTIAATFEPTSRASGTGFVIGMGRLSSIAGPYFAGWLFSAGLGHGAVSLIFAVCAVLAGLALATQPLAARADVES